MKSTLSLILLLVLLARLGAEDAKETKPPADVKVAFISYGEAEHGSTTLAQYAESLRAAGIKNVHTYLSPHTAHEFLTWPRSLHESAPLLFRDAP